jgi:inorganic pyrophosphatase
LTQQIQTDTTNVGSISTEEITALHAKLGEPLTEQEAQQASEELDLDGSGRVNFNSFLMWWSDNHASGKRGSSYRQRFKLIHAKLNSNLFDVDRIITQDSGEKYTLEYRQQFFYKQANSSLKQISPWHDIPLYRVATSDTEVNQNNLFNMVVEIPKWTRAKFECSTGEPFNPIKQDTQHGKLRYYKHGDLMVNYGFLPQTWEDPTYSPEDTGCPGDNDPIDCVEIGALQMATGTVCAVKVLGVLALIDDGETDWKVIVISISDPMSHLINDIDDVEVHLPGAIKAVREYFRDYKSFSGKINTYGLKAQAMPKSYAVKVIDDTHQHWKNLHLTRKQNIVGPGGADVVPSAAASGAAANAHGDKPTIQTTSNDVPSDVSVSLSPKLKSMVEQSSKEVKAADAKQLAKTASVAK